MILRSRETLKDIVFNLVLRNSKIKISLFQESRMFSINIFSIFFLKKT